jgi:phage tail sheath protein FI
MPEYLAPGVYFEPVDASRGAITGIRTDIAGFVGIAERGPVDTPVAVGSWEQFQSTFGGFIPNGYMAYAVKAFFENDGQFCVVVRVAAEPVQTQTDKNAVQPVDRLASLVASTAGFARGAMVTVRQTLSTQTIGAQPADRSASVVADVDGFASGGLVRISQGTQISWRRINAVDVPTKQLFWDEPVDAAYSLLAPISLQTSHQTDHLLRDVSGTQLTWERPLEGYYSLAHPIGFETGAAVAAGELLDEGGNPTLRIEAINPGTWGSAIAIRVGRTSPAATRTAPVPQPSNRSASIVESVVGFPLASLVRLYQPGTPGPSYRIVARVDAARNLLHWDLPLDGTYDLTDAENGTRPIACETIEFALSVYRVGELCEAFSGLSLLEKHGSGFVGNVVNGGSRLIRVALLPPLPAALPSKALASRLPNPKAPNLTRGVLALRGGRDGIAALQPSDFVGSAAADDKWGLRTLEDVDAVAIVAMPDILIKPVPPVETAPQPQPQIDPCLPGTLPPPVAAPVPPPPSERAPSFSLDQVAAVQDALIAHCEKLRDRIAVLDPPLRSHPAEMIDVAAIQSWRQRFDSKYAALYYPWVLVYDPLRLGGAVVRAIPPSGHVAGLFARTDTEVGVHKAPANIELRWAQGITDDISADVQSILNPLGINCIRNFAGRGVRLYGARTVSSDAAWRYVNVRRLLMMIEEAVEDATQWAVFEPNDLGLRHALILSISSFLEALWQRGALVGSTADEAFFVKCDSENNPPTLADLGQLLVEVGVAPVVPAEFVVFRIGKTADTLEIREANGRAV